MMASQSKMQSATSSSSLFHLSPHAQPFIFTNRQQSLGLSTTSLVKDSFSSLDTTWYSSEGFALNEYEGIVVGSSSMDDQSLLKTENHDVEGSQLFGEAIGSLSRHHTDVSATQTKAIAATEHLGSEHCLLPSFSYTTSLVRSAPPVVIDNIDYTSNVVDGKRYFSKYKCYEGGKSMDCPSLESYQVQPLDFRKSGEPLITRSKEVENGGGEKETDQSYVWINEMQVACLNRANQLKVNLKSTERGRAVDDSFLVVDVIKIDNEEDSDVDSPCWKGKDPENSPFVDPELTKSKPESGSALNPEAPQFLPRSFERRSSAQVLGELGGYVSMSSEKTKPPDSPPLFTNQVSWELSDAFNSTTGTGMLYESEENSIHADKNKMGCGINDSNSIAGADIDGDSFSFPMAMIHGDGHCSVLVETLLQLSKSLSTPLGPGVVDADILVDTIYDLSGLLVEVCSSSLFSKEQLQLEKLKHTINKLSLFSVRDVDGQIPSIHGLDVECIPSYLTKSVPEVGNLRKYELQKNPDSSMTMQNLKSLSSEILGNEVSQAAAMKSSSASGHEMEHQMSPQALIYKNLWLQATEELHFIKKKAWRNTKTLV